jgi:SAM-dependent methyltransferase
MNASELMDTATDPLALERTLRDLAAINRWLGGVRAIRLAIQPWLRSGRRLAILDIGCGGGDVAIAVEAFVKKAGASVTVTAIDGNEIIAGIAAARVRSRSGAHVACADAFMLPFRDATFDIALMSLTLHHFAANDAARVIHEMARVTSRAVVINELERTWANYLGARVLAKTLWRNSPFTRHDGPVSVLRAFTDDELARALDDRLLGPARVHRRFFYRLVAVAERRANSPAVNTVRA